MRCGKLECNRQKTQAHTDIHRKTHTNTRTRQKVLCPLLSQLLLAWSSSSKYSGSSSTAASGSLRSWFHPSLPVLALTYFLPWFRHSSFHTQTRDSKLAFLAGVLGVWKMVWSPQRPHSLFFFSLNFSHLTRSSHSKLGYVVLRWGFLFVYITMWAGCSIVEHWAWQSYKYKNKWNLTKHSLYTYNGNVHKWPLFLLRRMHSCILHMSATRRNLHQACKWMG